MRRLALLSLAALISGSAAPSALAGDAPASRSSAATKHKPFAHKAKAPHTCASCAAAAHAAHIPHAPAMPPGMMDGTIVGCAHSSNGVCAACRQLLAMPGQVTMVAPGGMPATAPGMPAAANAAAAPGRASIASSDAEPAPIGAMMQTNFAPGAAPSNAPAGMAAGAKMPTPNPATRAPFRPQTKEGNPRILGHLFGFSDMSRDFRDFRESGDRRKRDSHAATTYGETEGKVGELPASMVYGKRDR